MSQEEAAAQAGIDYKRLQRIEAGRVNVTVRTLVRIATALNTTVAQVFSPTASQRRSSS